MIHIPNQEKQNNFTVDQQYKATSTNAQSGTAVASAIKNKADKGTTLADYGITDAYTKLEVDLKVSGGGSAVDVPTKVSELENDSGYITAGAVENKADKATTLAGYSITDAYTKNEIDSKIVEIEVDNSNVISGKKKFSDIETYRSGYPSYRFLSSDINISECELKAGKKYTAKITMCLETPMSEEESILKDFALCSTESVDIDINGKVTSEDLVQSYELLSSSIDSVDFNFDAHPKIDREYVSGWNAFSKTYTYEISFTLAKDILSSDKMYIHLVFNERYIENKDYLYEYSDFTNVEISSVILRIPQRVSELQNDSGYLVADDIKDKADKKYVDDVVTDKTNTSDIYNPTSSQAMSGVAVSKATDLPTLILSSSYITREDVNIITTESITLDSNKEVKIDIGDAFTSLQYIQGIYTYKDSEGDTHICPLDSNIEIKGVFSDSGSGYVGGNYIKVKNISNYTVSLHLKLWSYCEP